MAMLNNQRVVFYETRMESQFWWVPSGSIVNHQSSLGIKSSMSHDRNPFFCPTGSNWTHDCWLLIIIMGFKPNPDVATLAKCSVYSKYQQTIERHTGHQHWGMGLGESKSWGDHGYNKCGNVTSKSLQNHKIIGCSMYQLHSQNTSCL